MTDLVRRALLGNAEAQKECTAQGIALPCPFCGEFLNAMKFRELLWPEGVLAKQFFSHSINGCVVAGTSTDKEHLAAWNTRAKPPVGECGTCAWYHKDGHDEGYCGQQGPGRAPSDFCSWYRPKGAQE